MLREDPDRRAVINARSRKWREANPEKFAAASRRWRAANCDYEREMSVQWHRDHREQSRANSRKWREANPERMRHNDNLRRARARAVGVGDAAALAAFELHASTAPNIRCYWCHKRTKPEERHRDHIIPLSRGGAHAAGNLCVSCDPCNRSKHAKMPEQFAGQSEISFT